MDEKPVGEVSILRQSTEIKFDIPQEVDVGKPIPASITARIVESVDWPNFAVALTYSEGASSSITVDWLGREFKISRGGRTIWVLRQKAREGMTIGLELRITFPSQTTHKLTAAAGYVENGKRFIQDSMIEKTVTAVRRIETPWWILPLTASIAAVAITATAIAVSEREVY